MADTLGNGRKKIKKKKKKKEKTGGKNPKTPPRTDYRADDLDGFEVIRLNRHKAEEMKLKR